jgi:hypothetical protein
VPLFDAENPTLLRHFGVSSADPRITAEGMAYKKQSVTDYITAA